MNAQVERFAKQKASLLEVATCLTLKQNAVAHAPYNCVACANKTFALADGLSFSIIFAIVICLLL